MGKEIERTMLKALERGEELCHAVVKVVAQLAVVVEWPRGILSTAFA
jgi:hypothetical protein